jgi:hypothetical protein
MRYYLDQLAEYGRRLRRGDAAPDFGRPPQNNAPAGFLRGVFRPGRAWEACQRALTGLGGAR